MLRRHLGFRGHRSVAARLVSLPTLRQHPATTGADVGHRPPVSGLAAHGHPRVVAVGGGGASERLRGEAPGYLPTQFFPGHPPGTVVSGFRNEDLAHQTFADGSFDLVLTQDVLEHVYEPAAVFVEIARTLRPGGAHVFSVPLVNKHRPSQVWAVRGSDGAPRFLHTPEFHGNPVDPRGAPVTMHWGFDIVEHIRTATGLDTEIHTLDELAHGVRAEYIEILVTRKPQS